MIGSLAANFHEGSRSEYLAQYVFASFGTAITVPHQEDSGFDIYCTLADRTKQRLWPRFHYTVQVKSTAEPWVFESAESVDWLVRHPFPIFLCVIDKKALQVRVYQTSPRFLLWTLLPLPSRVELIPGSEESGRTTEWSEGGKFSLSAPIIRANLSDFSDPEMHRRLKSALQFWIEVDRHNLQCIANGVQVFRVPDRYVSNVAKPQSGWVTQSRTRADDIGPAKRSIGGVLSWLTGQLAERGDLKGAARGALLLRHLFPHRDDMIFDPDYADTQPVTIQGKLNRLLGDDSYLFAGVDELARLIDERLERGNEKGGT